MNQTTEQIQARRFAASHRRAAIHAAALEVSRTQPFKKGSRVFDVSLSTQTSGPTGVVRIWAQEVVLTSLGKRQGTATHVENGENILSQIYRSGSLLMATREEVQAFADLVGPAAAEEAHLGTAHCCSDNLHNLYPHLVTKAEAEIAAELAAADAKRYEVVFR